MQEAHRRCGTHQVRSRSSADGAGLRQLTAGAGVSDFDPIYLPDGRILFTSTREPKSVWRFSARFMTIRSM